MSKTQPDEPITVDEAAELPRRGERKEIPGILHAREGSQPVKDLKTFLQSLPDFGEDGERLHEAIMEERAWRRKAAREKPEGNPW